MNHTPQITPDMLIFISGIFSLFLIGFTLVVREMVKAMRKDEPKKPKYSKKPFEGWTHRFIVLLHINNHSMRDIKYEIYSNSGSNTDLHDFINKNKAEEVDSVYISNVYTKEYDDETKEIINDFLKFN